MAHRIVLAGLVLVLSIALPHPVAAQADDQVRVIHITIDSLHPDEVGELTPFLMELRDNGTWYEEARAIMASETLPNHIAMGTGAYAGRHGIPGNDGFASADDSTEADPDLGIPELREAHSLFAAIEAECPELRTVGVFSKQYVWRTFSEDPADAYFDQPTYNIPESGHAPEAATVPFLLEQIATQDPPDYLFANLGDVDRSGHIDGSGSVDEAAFRTAAIIAADNYLRQIVEALRTQGLWESTILVISSDHSMDYSNPVDPASRVDLAAALDADPATTSRFGVSENGGAGFVYLLDPGSSDDEDEVLRDARSIIADIPGVAGVFHRLPNPLDPGQDLASVHPAWNLHQTERTGSLFVHTEAGYAVGSQSSNPLPGNHGHGVTRNKVALIAGGWDGIVSQSVAAGDPGVIDVVDDTEALPEQAEQVDYAPTFGWLLGITDPGITLDGDPQWQGRVLDEAFERQPTAVCGVAASAPATTAAAAAPTTTAPRAEGRLPATGASAGLLAIGVLGLAAFVIARRRSA